jgi:uncharacterized protein (TIRG00374 family)
MAIVTPRIFRRGLEWFAGLSLVVLGGLLIYTDGLQSFWGAIATLNPIWVAAAIGVASLDWVAGGARLWVVARHVYPATPFGGMVLAGGMNTWASQLTPSGTGGGPVMIWIMRRFGVPYPEGVTSALITFIATIVFLASIGPLALIFGAGESLREHGIALGVTVLDLFRASLSVFVVIAVVLLAVIVFPGRMRNLVHRLAVRIGRRSAKVQAGLERLQEGVNRAHDCVITFFRGRGWVALLGAVILSGPTFGNRLLAGYVILRALGIEAHFVDVLMLQTLILFLIYFAPTPGGSGLAEILGAALMSIYVPRELIPTYAVLWRLTTSYVTVGAGSVIFWYMLRRRLIEPPDAAGVPELPYP